MHDWNSAIQVKLPMVFLFRRVEKNTDKIGKGI